MSGLLSVETTFFTVLDYPMSYIEFFGTVFCLWSVWLIAKRDMMTWPIGIVSVLLLMALYYQIQLYSDALEQVYYLGASVYGWWYWSSTRNEEEDLVAVNFSTRRAMLAWIALTAVFSVLLGVCMTRIHTWFPAVFAEPASYPYLDALTTVMSFVAMWLMTRKHTESWVYWIIVDVIGIGLYFVKGVKFISLLYVILLVLATRGLIIWLRAASRPIALGDRQPTPSSQPSP